jgi:hypothetical protein
VDGANHRKVVWGSVLHGFVKVQHVHAVSLGLKVQVLSVPNVKVLVGGTSLTPEVDHLVASGA